MNDDMYPDERNPMRLPFRTTEIAALLLVAVVLAGTFMTGGYFARRPLLADLASANATAAEAQDMAAEATEAAQEAQDEVTGLAVRIEDAEAEAALSEDVLGDIIEKLDALGFKTTVSEEGTVTITAPKVTPQKAPAKKSGGVTTASTGTGWKTAQASWYGPGFYGNTTANGTVLTETSMNVAVPQGMTDTYPFGTRIEFRYKGRTCVAIVNDTGSFAKYGRLFDLGPGTAKALDHFFTGPVEYRILP
jgi:rare lipoprotein A (peptidoglycan hydrolase)